jgi:hypothetical protein
MTPFNLKALVVELGHEFKRRGMTKHAALLRGFYREEFQRDRREGWRVDMVLEWLALLRIGPLASFYEVHLKRTGCPFCNAKPTLTESVVYVETAWEGGAKMKCTSCQRAWLRPDER